jgi:periplasmic mercuric ion binding protein
LHLPIKLTFLETKMKVLRATVGAALLGLMLAGAAQAETKVTVKGVHLCCGACVTGVEDAVATVNGAKVECDRGAKTVTVTAPDVQTAQKTLDALADAGFHGKVDGTEVAFKPVDVKPGKVAKLEVSGVHNCCGQCTKIIKSTLTGVEGVKSDTVKAREGSFIVEGDFEAAKRVEAPLNAGFHVTVKQ